MTENVINIGGRSTVEKDPRFSIRNMVEQSARKIATVTGIVDKKNFEKILQIVKAGHNLRFLEKMNYLSHGQKLDDLVEEWGNYLPIYGLKEKTDIKKFRNRLSDDREIKKSEKVTEEIRGQLVVNGINLNNRWDFGFETRRKGVREKMLTQTSVLRKIFDKHHLPNIIDGDALLDFTYLPKYWKERLLSENFRTKIDDFKIDYNSLPELIEIYRRLESRKFRRQKKIIAANKEKLKNITSERKNPVNITEFENILTLLK